MNSVAGNVTVDKKKSVAGGHPKLDEKLATMEEEGNKICFNFKKKIFKFTRTFS